MADKQVVRWSGYPGANRGWLPEILKIPPGDGRRVICLSQSLVGVYTHFFEGRTTPCTAKAVGNAGELAGCHVDHQRTSTRWQGWLGVQLDGRPSLYMACITESTIRDAQWLLQLGGKLRGTRFLLYRRSNSARGKLCAAADARQLPPPDRMLPEPDVKAFLVRLWGMIPREGLSDEAVDAADMVRLADVDKMVQEVEGLPQQHALAKLLKETLGKGGFICET